MKPITVITTVRAPLDAVWRAWTTPADIKAWNAASEDWHTTSAEIDLRRGGRFSYRMEAKDGSAGFDFSGTFIIVDSFEQISYRLDDGRIVLIAFSAREEGVEVKETFAPERIHDLATQRDRWQAILDNFASYVEGH